jgi:hypothetical protein
MLAEAGKFSIESAQEAALSFVHEPAVQQHIASGQAEVTVFAVESGLQCRGRLDWIAAHDDVIVDLKTARAVTKREFTRDFYKYHYDVKLGLYRRWLSVVMKRPFRVEVIAIENSPPYDVVVYPVADAVMDRGAHKGLEIIARTAACIQSGIWPGVANGGYGVLQTPPWEMDDGEEYEDFDEEDDEVMAYQEN